MNLQCYFKFSKGLRCQLFVHVHPLCYNYSVKCYFTILSVVIIISLIFCKIFSITHDFQVDLVLIIIINSF
jgi:hypothetical protein